MDANSVYEDARSTIEKQSENDNNGLDDPNCDTGLTFQPNQIDKCKAVPKKEQDLNTNATEASLENTTIKSGCCKGLHSHCVTF